MLDGGARPGLETVEGFFLTTTMSASQDTKPATWVATHRFSASEHRVGQLRGTNEARAHPGRRQKPSIWLRPLGKTEHRSSSDGFLVNLTHQGKMKNP